MSSLAVPVPDLSDVPEACSSVLRADRSALKVGRPLGGRRIAEGGR
ncbi:hypothetical protein [Kitasatospora sp. DSM 101779]|nr:hypothetical protein [Kitasatospora sp. DSM 101779]MCU7820597.1 hypothetical protein [Kitasatospora sp. DSM 101779]